MFTANRPEIESSNILKHNQGCEQSCSGLAIGSCTQSCTSFVVELNNRSRVLVAWDNSFLWEGVCIVERDGVSTLNSRESKLWHTAILEITLIDIH